uniref:ATP synthase F1 subunit gamma n=1 Tax=Acrasis kona TaxID=1008807 RepID=A0A0B4MZR9_9EUKA|nr:ATP synthase F1 subunit gamma [Acrasis kona]AID52058.1 ATP synthase F1 subunit gamma [Acrasis kona]
MNSRKLKKKQVGYIKFKELAKSLKASAISMLSKLKNHLNKRNITLDYFIPFFNLYDNDNISLCLDTNILFINFGVDKSCIGAHNINICNKINNLYKIYNENSIIKMYGIGKYMKYFIKKNYKNNYYGNVLNIDKEPFSLTLSTIISEKILENTFDKYFLVFNKYIDIFQQKTCYYELPGIKEFYKLCLELNTVRSKKVINFLNFIHQIKFKPLYDVLKELYYFVFSIFLLDSLEENNLSGIGSRISCMDNCITNAEKKIEETTLLYNKARQEEITNELVAIITAAQAIMDNELFIKNNITSILEIYNHSKIILSKKTKIFKKIYNKHIYVKHI